MENDLKFSGVSPVVIDYNGSTDDIYAPVRGSSCDVNIVSSHILDDLYTPMKDDIVVRIKRDYNEYRYEMNYSAGTLLFSNPLNPTVEIYGGPNDTMVDPDGNTYDLYNLTSINYKFYDIDGELNLRCNINLYSDASVTESDVWLKARIREVSNSSGQGKYIVFDRANKWNLTNNDRYFYCGRVSLKHTIGTNGIVYVQTPGSPVPGSWTNIGYHARFNSSGTRITGVNYIDVADLVHFEDGTEELITSDSMVGGVYTFMVKHESGGNYAGWKLVTSYYTDEDSQRLYIDGKYCTKVKLFNLERESIDVTDVSLCADRTDLAGPVHIYTLDHTTHTGAERAVGPGDSSTPANEAYVHYRFFTDSDHNLFLWNKNGNIVGLAEQSETFTWVGYATASRLAGTFSILCYLGDVFLHTYSLTNQGTVTKYMGNGWWNPRQRSYFIEIPVPGSEYLWEGYVMPNTYSQPLTQNLDNITMTAIDPVSILKFVKINNLFNKTTILTYRQILAYTLSYVMLSKNTLKIERNVSYGGDYDGSNGLLNLKLQVSNFWDESDEPANAYDMISEMLKPFCMTLVFNSEGFQIYNTNKTEGDRVFDNYTINANGSLTYIDTTTESSVLFDFNQNDWKSNNTQEASIEIGPTYDKVTGVASTMIPTYSKSLFDIVDYDQREKYDVFDVNVQRNKTKGYRRMSNNSIQMDTNDVWYYIWNGVYTDELYHLKSNGGYVNGYININKFNWYKTGAAGNPDDYGSLLNFYGGTNNPTATGKTQDQEKAVEVHKRITAYAEDNGTPLELWDTVVTPGVYPDLYWTFTREYDPEYGTYETPHMTKYADERDGTEKTMQQSNRQVYHQEYSMNLSSNDEHIIDFSLVQSYSRTGIDSKIDIYQNNTCDNKMFSLDFDDDTQKYYATLINSSKVAYFPALWNASSVKVDQLYFSRYKTASTLTRPPRLQPVWDKRRVMMYIQKSDNSVLQFNGKEWVSDLHPENANSFYLMKMMNDEKLFHTDFRYDLIETSDGSHYSLTNDRYTYYTDEAGGVVDHSVSGGTTHYCEVYKSEVNAWDQWVDKCGEGQLSIKMPQIDDLNAKVCVDVYNSTMLGMTGSNSTGGGQQTEMIYWSIEGTGRIWDDDQQEYVYITLSNDNTNNYGSITGILTYIDYIPYNVSYVKGEHLDVEVSVSIPESNLGQMFSESDIQYTIDKNMNYVEEFNGPSFQVNTYNELVHSSFSYLIFDTAVADPSGFFIAGVNARPEGYTVQAYMNWLSVVRKIYKKTLLPKNYTYKFSNIRTFIKSPEVSTNRQMVISDSWDLKTNRHSITAIECEDLDVDTVSSFTADELPRRARAERYNLPTAQKRT